MKKPLLALDTSTAACSAAVFMPQNQEIFSAYEQKSAKHTQVLLPLIDEVLRKAGCKVADLGRIINSKGPGAFTGLRVGAACASALAFSYSLNLGTVSSLATLATESPKEGKILTLIDARMKQLYAGLYLKEGENLSKIKEDFLLDIDKFPEFAKQADMIVGCGEIFKAEESDKFLVKSPKAENIFKILNLVHWQQGIEPISLNYLRNEITS